MTIVRNFLCDTLQLCDKLLFAKNYTKLAKVFTSK